MSAAHRRCNLSPGDFTIRRLGEGRYDSPLTVSRYVDETDRIAYHAHVDSLFACGTEPSQVLAFDEAGPRRKLFFDPRTVTCGIVTCGGLCPGLNDVIRALVLQLYHGYKVPKILGFRYGYEGLCPRYGHAPLELTVELVRDIHEQGGTILGSSRGNQDIGEMVDTLERLEVNVLFTIGGDGTLRGAHDIAEECRRRGLPIAIVGVPKTIDNDIAHIHVTFGMETAMSVAHDALTSAHTEAANTRNGVGLVQLMGRESGFIACYATLASGHVNFCLIPENPFRLEGENGLLALLRRRLARRRHALIVVAEGAGQDLVTTQGKDASGNVKFGDIGLFLKEAITCFLDDNNIQGRVRYIDPSYLVRSVRSNAHDSVFCTMLAQHAAHAAMAGFTDLVIGFWSNEFTHVPIPLATSERKKVNLDGDLWQSVLQQTGQPMHMR